MRNWLLAAAVVAVSSTAVNAQAPFINKPIDPDRLVIRPANTLANVTSAGTGGGIRALGQSVAGMLEDNGFVRTVNNLLGRRGRPVTTQDGFSALPMPSTFQSTRYQNSFVPRMPVVQRFGTTPNVTR
jgi:hypothetical protein